MNRDEKDAARENVTGIDQAQAVALGALPAEILAGDAVVPVLDPQAAVDAAVSRATGNQRQWDRGTLALACKAARPVVENDLRQSGRAFTRDEIRTGVRTRVSAYASKYGVSLPGNVVLGATPLKAVAADVCGAFSWPWSYFMPKPIADVAKAAQSGNPRATAFLKKVFGGKSAAPATAPAASAPEASSSTATITAAATAAPTTTLGRSFWSNMQHQIRRENRNSDRQNQGARSWDNNNQGNGSGRRKHRHHRHHRNGQSGTSSTYNPNLPVSSTNVPPSTFNPGQPVSLYNVPPAGYQGQTYNPALPVSAYNVPPTGFNPAVPQALISEYQAAHQPANAPAYNPYLPQTYNPALPVSASNPLPTYNPNLPVSAYNVPPGTQPPAANYPTTSNYIPGDDSFGSGDSLGSATLGAWLHELNPLYWLKSKEERANVDKEHQAWIDNAEIQKQNAKRQEVLDAGQKAAVAQQAVAAARAKSAEIEAQLKSIETQLSGACSGKSSIGTIGPAEIVGFAEIVGRDDSDRKANPFDDNLPSADAAPVISKVKKARALNADNSKELTPICAKMEKGQPLSPEESGKVLILLARNEQLHEFRKNLVSGEAYKDNPSRNKIQRQVVLGAVRALTPDEQNKMLQIVALSKQGNPNAQKALIALQAQGYAATMGYAGPTAKVAGVPMTPSEQAKLAALVKAAKQKHPGALRAIALLNTQGYKVSLMGSDTYVGWGIDDAFSLALKPVTVPLKYLWKGTKAAARGLGITHGGQSAEQVRLGRLKAAQQRRRAAQARARAADAQSDAEYRAQQQLADAADAEADASDAEATAKEAAMLTAEAQYLPGQTDEEAAAAQATDSSGYTTPIVTPLPPTPTPSAMPEIKKARRARVAKKNPLAAKILTKSEEDSPAGIKLRASMELYKKAEKRKSKERKAVKVMVKRAKAGDKQAMADVQALKAAGIAVKAERSAGRHVAAVAAYRATEKKVKSTRMRAEVAMAQKGVELSRAHQLRKIAILEKKAAAGDKKSVAIVKNQVAKAKAGDPGSKKVVAALVLAKHTRATASTPRTRRDLRQASRLAARAAKGDKRALAQVNVINSAARAGNPNAKRAQNRIQTAAAVRYAIKTGTFVLPAVVVTSQVAKKREDAKKKLAARREKDAKLVASVDAKIKTGKATKGEVLAASRASANLGDKAAAASFMAIATAMPSKKQLDPKSKEFARAKAQVFAAKSAADKGQGTREQIQQGALAAVAVGAPVTAAELMAASASHPSKDEAPLADDHKKVTTAQDKVAAKTASREEALAGAKAAADMGDKEKAAELATAAATLPSSKEELNRVATVAAASRAGNPLYQEQVTRAQELAATGDPRGVEAMGKLTGVQALDQVAKGKDIDAPMKTAVKDLQAAKEGDPAALAKIEQASEQARTGNPEAIKYAVYAAGAATVASALANNPAAETEWLRRNGVVPKDAAKNDVRIVDAEIVTPLSSLPDQPLPPITTVFGVIKEGLAALVCATRDPFQNYKEGVMSRGRLAPVSAAGDDKDPESKAVEKKKEPGSHEDDWKKYGVHGDVGADASRDKLINDTKTRLSALVNKATSGDKDSQKKWEIAKTNYAKNKKLAAGGDAKAKAVVDILEATKLFSK